MKVLVTGGTGFIGSHLVEGLSASGHDVVCLVRNRSKANALFGDRLPTLVVGNLTDERALTEAVNDADAVYHVAGLIAARSTRELFAINADATLFAAGITATSDANAVSVANGVITSTVFGDPGLRNAITAKRIPALSPANLTALAGLLGALGAWVVWRHRFVSRRKLRKSV